MTRLIFIFKIDGQLFLFKKEEGFKMPQYGDYVKGKGIFRGYKKVVEKEECYKCDGSGEVYKTRETCSKCGGNGYVSGLFGDRVCSRCDGSGSLAVYEKCPVCKGSGYVKTVVEKEVWDPRSW